MAGEQEIATIVEMSVGDPYKILLIEDSESDAILLKHALDQSGLVDVIKRVDNEEAFASALANDEWDLVLSDYVLPVFSADKALKLLNATRPDIPFIVVSGKVDEREVVATLRAGAEHFISKDDMGRLPIAAERAVMAARRRRNMAAELRRHREHLEDLVAERTAELKETNERLQEEIQRRERFEDALRDSETQYRDLVESAVDGICIIQDQKLQFVNQQLQEMTGYDSEEAIGTSFTDYISATQSERVSGLYRRIIKGEDDSQRYETVLLTRRGRALEVGISAKAIDYHGRRGVMVVVRDVTEQKRARRLAMESERLEAVGIVARGVGNNFTNIMSVIGSYAASIADSFLPHTRPHSAARKILDAAQHASDLTKRLLSVVRVSETDTQIEVEPVSLKEAIEKARDLVGHSLRARNVEVSIRKEDRLPYVMADKSQLLDTLMNILLNAADAMPTGGTVTIDYVERRISKPRSNPSAEGGTFVGLSIQDTGVGMPKEQVARVFEPFFTTKDSQEAFGLGLPVAQSMAQSWGGWIDIRSRVGKGTRVRIFMAKAEAPEEVVDATVHPTNVLVVDDNRGRRTMMKEALEQQGHAVIEAADGDVATRIIKERADEIGLFVIDWIIPGRDSKSVLQSVLAHDPQAKVIMVSGFSRDYVRSEIRIGAWSFLQKPFSKDEFAETIEEVLGR